MTIRETPVQLTNVLDHLPDAVLWLEPLAGTGDAIADFLIGYANKPARTLLSPAATSPVGLHLQRDAALHGITDTTFNTCCTETLLRQQRGEQWIQAGPQQLHLVCTPCQGGVLCTLRLPAVTDSAEAEKLRSLKWMVDQAPIGMVLYRAERNAEGKITDFRVELYNQRSNELVGITEAQRKSYTFRQILELLGIPHVFQFYINIVENGAILQVEQFIPPINRWLFVSTVKLNDGFVVMHTDISELKRSEQSVQEQSVYLNSILNASLNALVVMEAQRDTQGRITDFVYRQVNASFLSFVNRTEAELMGAGMLALFPGTGKDIFEAYQTVVETGESRHAEVPYTNGAQTYWLDLRIAPLSAGRVVATFADITSRKEAFRQLEEQKKLLDNILRYSSNGIAVSEMIRDTDGRVVDGRTILANEAASQFTGLPLEVYLSKTARELDPNIIDSDYYRACIRTLDTGEPIRTQYYLESARKWLELSVSKMDSQRLIHVFTDVTSIKQAQLDMEQSAVALRTVFNAAQAGMFTFAPYYEGGVLVDFYFVMANATIAAYVGQTPDALVGSRGSKWFPGYLTNGVFQMYKETYLSGQPSRRDVHYNVDGINVYLDLQCVKVSGQLLVSFTDHTALRNTQAQLEKTVEDLSRMNANLEQFAYSASHDLKEPIRKINFFSERLRELMAGRLGEAETDLLQRMEKACLRMNTLIDDLLEYSRVSRGAHQFERVPLDETLRAVLENLELQLQDSKAEVAAQPLPTVNGHRQQLQQLFQNLLENALKYRHHARNPRLAIQVRQAAGSDPLLAERGAPAARQYHLLSFADNGIGFNPEDAERIFQVFTRLHGRSEYAGTGVGLSIARKVAENHNGYIWAEGRSGEGAVFWVALPV